MLLTRRMPLVLLLAFSSEAFSSEACEPETKWSIIGVEFHLKCKICKEIPGNGALKIAVPTGFDLSNSNITKQEPEGWKLTKSGTTIKLETSNTIPANTSIEITMSKAKAPAHYMAPFYVEFDEFDEVVSKNGFDCAKCNAAPADPTGTGGNIPSSTVDCEVSTWGKWSDCSASCGAGNKTRTRTVKTEPQKGGTECLALNETESCNEAPCQVVVPFLLGLKKRSAYVATALFKLKSDTKDAEVRSLNLEGKWGGIKVNDNGMLTELVIKRVGKVGDDALKGPLPDFSEHADLEVVNLFNHELTGSIPDLSKTNAALRELTLQRNKLTGSVPKNFPLKIVKIHVTSNELTGTLGDFSKYTALKQLFLVENYLTGIPAWKSNTNNYPPLRKPGNDQNNDDDWDDGLELVVDFQKTK